MKYRVTDAGTLACTFHEVVEVAVVGAVVSDGVPGL